MVDIGNLQTKCVCIAYTKSKHYDDGEHEELMATDALAAVLSIAEGQSSMTSPQSDGQSDRPTIDAEPAVDSDVLEKVLQETLSAADADQSLDGSEFEVFQEVARRHAGQQLSLDPIVTELIQSILLYRFGEPIRRTRDWDEMTREIAETLWESPHSRDRIHRLWDRLAEIKP